MNRDSIVYEAIKAVKKYEFNILSNKTLFYQLDVNFQKYLVQNGQSQLFYEKEKTLMKQWVESNKLNPLQQLALASIIVDQVDMSTEEPTLKLMNNQKTKLIKYQIKELQQQIASLNEQLSNTKSEIHSQIGDSNNIMDACKKNVTDVLAQFVDNQNNIIKDRIIQIQNNATQIKKVDEIIDLEQQLKNQILIEQKQIQTSQIIIQGRNSYFECDKASQTKEQAAEKPVVKDDTKLQQTITNNQTQIQLLKEQLQNTQQQYELKTDQIQQQYQQQLNENKVQKHEFGLALKRLKNQTNSLARDHLLQYVQENIGFLEKAAYVDPFYNQLLIKIKALM